MDASTNREIKMTKKPYLTDKRAAKNRERNLRREAAAEAWRAAGCPRRQTDGEFYNEMLSKYKK
jgi:hypothetical protein